MPNNCDLCKSTRFVHAGIYILLGLSGQDFQIHRLKCMQEFSLSDNRNDLFDNIHEEKVKVKQVERYDYRNKLGTKRNTSNTGGPCLQ